MLITTAPAHAEESPIRAVEDDKAIVSLSVENDLFAGHDSNYTNGVRASWLSPESMLPDWIEDSADALPFFSKKGYKRWHAEIGQSMFTPTDISQPLLQPNDRPYAGWLYGSVGILSDTGYRLDNLQLTLGMVGYNAGLSKRRSPVTAGALIAVMAAVITLVVDIDRPRDGFLTVNQQPLIDLQQQIGAAPGP